MTVLTNARILDVREGTFKEGALSLGEGKIASIDGAASAPGAKDAIDLEGAYLLPGIITCHTHLSIVFPFHETNENESPAITALRCQKRANDALQAGITTVSSGRMWCLLAGGLWGLARRDAEKNLA